MNMIQAKMINNKKYIYLIIIFKLILCCNPSKNIADSNSLEDTSQKIDNKNAIIDCWDFYNNYYGHKEEYLQKIINLNRKKTIIWLIGDSTIDNKEWFGPKTMDKLPSNYEILRKPYKIKEDVCYHLNTLIDNKKYIAINCAVEGAKVETKENTLTNQDKLVKNNIKDGDILIVSIGGNDIALSPSNETRENLKLITSSNGSNQKALNYFLNIFKTKIENYIKEIISNKIPKEILVCMLYYPNMDKSQDSWASSTLENLEYDTNPKNLQNLIKFLFNEATKKIKINNIKITPVSLFKIMDGTNSSDYEKRVEPSILGGKKMATEFKTSLKL